MWLIVYMYVSEEKNMYIYTNSGFICEYICINVLYVLYVERIFANYQMNNFRFNDF